MPSTFFGLELGKRALVAQQLAIDITGHNISNANSPSYTRQIPNLVAPNPYTVMGYSGQLTLGTGVDLGSVTRARDNFTDKQFRNETALQAYWTQKQDGLQKVEGIMNEPTDNSLHGDMDALWAAFGELANNPENAGARTVVQERAIALTEGFHQVVNQIETLKQDSMNSISVNIDQVNTIAKQIGALNAQIKKAEVNGDNPNDLRDQRDDLVDQLSKFFSVTVEETKDQSFTDRTVNNYAVKIGNHDLVRDSIVSTIKLPVDFTTNDVQWSDGSSVLAGDGHSAQTGSIKADFDVLTYLGDDTNGLEGKYNLLAQGIIDVVNDIHKKGYDGEATPQPGGDFFTTTDPTKPGLTIKLVDAIKNDGTLIAAAANPGVDNKADGQNALYLSSLKDGFLQAQTILGALPTTEVFSATSFSDYYGATVAGVGVDTQEANRMVSSTSVLVTHLLNQRQSLSGVSLDEEMTNLVRYQKSYSAAARIVTMMDDMLDTIVNRMGTTR